MRTYRECIPCFYRQALDAARLVGADEATQKKVLNRITQIMPAISLEASPPEIASTIYKAVEEVLGNGDPFKAVKEKSNKLALALYPRMKRLIHDSYDPLLTALRVAVAGNVIDYAVGRPFDLEKEIEEVLHKQFRVFDYVEFAGDLFHVNLILYLADNAGEIVFDKLLIETLSRNVVVAVRDKPIINDATLEDARQSGLDKITRVISSGCHAPGTVLKFCSKEFMDIYNDADLIISKGQGNFEAPHDTEKKIFFLFKAKCPVVARDIGCEVGDIVFKARGVRTGSRAMR